MEPVVEPNGSAFEHGESEEAVPPATGLVADKLESFWKEHEIVLKAKKKFSSFPGFLKLFLKLPQPPTEIQIENSYCCIYRSSFDLNFRFRIFPEIDCEENNRPFFQALSGLCLSQYKEGEHQRYVIIKFVGGDKYALRLLKLERNVYCPDQWLRTDNKFKLVYMNQEKFMLYQFDKNARKLLGDTPQYVLEKRRVGRQVRRVVKGKTKDVDFQAESESESGSGTESENDQEQKLRKDGQGSGHGKGSGRGPSGSRSQNGKRSGASEGAKRGKHDSVSNGAGHAGPPPEGTALPVPPCAGQEQASAAAGVAAQFVTPPPQDAVVETREIEEDGQDEAMFLLDLVSCEVIARSVKNPAALAQACLEVVEQKKKRKQLEGQALSGDGMEGVNSTVKQWRKDAIEKMKLKGIVYRPPPTKYLEIANDLGGRYPINDLFTLFMNRKYKGNAVLAPVEADGEVSTRKTLRHPKQSAASGVRDGSVRLKEKEVKAVEATRRYIHMDCARTPSREQDLLVVLLNKHMTATSWEQNFPHLQSEGVDIRFAVMIHPDVWDRLSADLRWRLFLEPTSKGFLNKSYFLFEGVEEGLVFDYGNMRDLCTAGLVEIYEKCNQYAKEHLKHDGRSLHEILEEALLPVIHERLRLENKKIENRKQKRLRDQEKYEERKRADPKDPTNKPPKLSLPDLLNGVDEDEIPQPFPDSVHVVLIPLVFAVTCSRNLGLAHSNLCGCNSSRYPNPVTNPIFERYVEKPSTRLCDMCGLTLPRDLIGLSSCIPLCDFYQGRL